ncbi:hypothetical protein ACSHWB_46880 [Lentzea sp. HUAS TT2]
MRPLAAGDPLDPVSLGESGCTSCGEHLGMTAQPDQAWLDAIRYD